MDKRHSFSLTSSSILPRCIMQYYVYTENRETHTHTILGHVLGSFYIQYFVAQSGFVPFGLVQKGREMRGAVEEEEMGKVVGTQSESESM